MEFVETGLQSFPEEGFCLIAASKETWVAHGTHCIFMHFPRHRVIDWGHSSKWEIQRERGDCCTLLSCPNLIYIQHLPEDGLRSVYFYCFGQWLHVCALDMTVYRLRFIQMDRWRYGGKMISSWGTMSLADLLSGTTPMTPGRRQSFAWLKFRHGRWEHERIAVVCLADAGIWPLRSFQQPWVLWICGKELSDNVSGPEPTSNHQTTDCQKARSSYEVVTNAQWANNIARPIAFQMLGMQDKWHQTTSTDMHRVRERRLELNWVQWNSSAASYCAFIRPLGSLPTRSFEVSNDCCFLGLFSTRHNLWSYCVRASPQNGADSTTTPECIIHVFYV